MIYLRQKTEKEIDLPSAFKYAKLFVLAFPGITKCRLHFYFTTWALRASSMLKIKDKTHSSLFKQNYHRITLIFQKLYFLLFKNKQIKTNPIFINLKKAGAHTPHF